MAVAYDNHVVRPVSVQHLGTDPADEIVAEIISASPRGVTQILQLNLESAKRTAEDLVECIRAADPKYRIR